MINDYKVQMFNAGMQVKDTVSYPAALINNPVCKAILKVVQCHLLDLPSNGRSHARHLHCRLCQPKHTSNRLPTSITADVVTD